ncbi:hypothetical protein Tco_0356832 [Tanacetum coccineum]
MGRKENFYGYTQSTPQLPSPRLKVNEKIVKLRLFGEEQLRKSRLLSYNNMMTTFQLIVWTMNKVGILKTCEEFMGFTADEDVQERLCVTLVASPKEFQTKRKETGVSYALVVKDVTENAIPVVIKPLLAEFGKIVTDDTPDALPPLRNIQHQIDLSRKTTLLVSISNEVLGFDSIKELYASDEDSIAFGWSSKPSNIGVN